MVTFCSTRALLKNTPRRPFRFTSTTRVPRYGTKNQSVQLSWTLPNTNESSLVLVQGYQGYNHNAFLFQINMNTERRLM